MKIAGFVGRLTGSLAIFGFCAWTAAGSDAELRATMHELFAQIRIVLPLALDDATFAHPDNRARVSIALRALEKRAGILAAHGQKEEAGFAFQSDSLSQHAQSIARSYARGETQTARFLLNRSLDDCVACHSKLPTAHEFPMGQRLLEDVDLASLSARERARIQVVARQFEAALSSYESLFRQSDAFESRLVSAEDWVSYLKICLTIENDAPRARDTLVRLRQRPDLPTWLVHDAGSWIATIEILQSAPLEGDPLERARALLRRSDALVSTPPTRGGLVYQLEAWHELQRFVAAPGPRRVDLGEAYYLLGATEADMLRPFGWSAASPYLEAAIRTSPREAPGRDAFTLLEKLTVLGYTGSGGTRVPADLQKKLDTLEKSLGKESK